MLDENYPYLKYLQLNLTPKDKANNRVELCQGCYRKTDINRLYHALEVKLVRQNPLVPVCKARDCVEPSDFIFTLKKMTLVQYLKTIEEEPDL